MPRPRTGSIEWRPRPAPGRWWAVITTTSAGGTAQRKRLPLAVGIPNTEPGRQTAKLQAKALSNSDPTRFIARKKATERVGRIIDRWLHERRRSGGKMQAAYERAARFLDEWSELPVCDWTEHHRTSVYEAIEATRSFKGGAKISSSTVKHLRQLIDAILLQSGVDKTIPVSRMLREIAWRLGGVDKLLEQVAIEFDLVTTEATDAPA